MPEPVSARVRLRGFRPEDASRVADITISAYDAYGTISDGYRDYLNDPAHRAATSSALFVAEIDRQIVGTVTVVLPGDPAWQGRTPAAGDASFRVLAVAPEAEGAGVGRALVDRAIGSARDSGRHRIIIVSMEWMRRAHALYERRGFIRRPDLDLRYPGGVGYFFHYDLTSEAPHRFAVPGSPPETIPWFEDTQAR